jgi:hypothetical protein
MTKIDEILHFLFDDIIGNINGGNNFLGRLQVKFCWWA